METQLPLSTRLVEGFLMLFATALLTVPVALGAIWMLLNYPSWAMFFGYVIGTSAIIGFAFWQRLLNRAFG